MVRTDIPLNWLGHSKIEGQVATSLEIGFKFFVNLGYSKTDLVELVYALHVSGVFNKSSAVVKQIATHFENVFNVTLGNYYGTFQEIRIRKTGQVNFINQLKEGLVKLIREKDS